jgi:hypothetical protein
MYPCNVEKSGISWGGGRFREKYGTDHVCVKVQDGDWLAVGPGQGTQGREGDGVVATEGDEFGVDVRGWVGVGERTARQELEVGLGHLAESEGVVQGRDGDIAAVEEARPRIKGVDAGPGAEGAV